MRSTAVLALLSVAGCTTELKVQPIQADIERSRIGAPYAVPFTQYTIDVTREVASCGPVMKIKTTAEVKSADIRRDPKLRFALDTNGLTSAFKTSDVKLEYDPNGVVTALNASVEDRTAQVIGNIVGSAAKILSIAAAGSGTSGAEACSPEVIAALSKAEELRPGLEAAKKAVKAKTAALEQLQKKAASLGANIDEGTKAKIASTQDDLAAAADDIDKKTKELADPLRLISQTDTLHWPEDGDTFSGAIPIANTTLRKFGSVDTNPSVTQPFAIYLTLSPIVPGGRDVTRAAYVDSRLGIPFRSGEPAHLVVCSGGPCGNAHAELLAEKVGDALQLGPIFYLPCTSHPFSSSSCSFAFANDGSLKSIGTVNKTATAEAVTGTLSSNLDTLSGLQTTLSGAKAKQLAAETAELKAEADYAAAKAALADNPNEAILLETTATKARIELLQAQKAEWDARVALAQTQALTGVAP